MAGALVGGACTPDTALNQAIEPQLTGQAFDPEGFSSTTSGAQVLRNGRRRLFVAYEHFGSALDSGGENITGTSTLKYAFSDDDGVTWTRNSVPASALGGFGLDTILGSPAVATFPVVPPYTNPIIGNGAVVYLVALASGIGPSGVSRTGLVVGRSDDSGTTFGQFPEVGAPTGTFPFSDPSAPSAAMSNGDVRTRPPVPPRLHIAYLSRANTPNALVAYTSAALVTMGGSAPTLQYSQHVSIPLFVADEANPGETRALTPSERQGLRRAIVRTGLAPNYIAIELVEPLPPEQVTDEHNARLRILLARTKFLMNTEWEVSEPLNFGAPILVRDQIDSGVGPVFTPSSTIDFARVGQTSAGVLAPLFPSGRNHVVWAGHSPQLNGATDQIFYQSFTTTQSGAQGYADTFEAPYAVSAYTNDRVFQPTVSAVGPDAFVSWYQQSRTTGAVRLMGRRTRDGGLTFEPITVLSEITGGPGPSESLCPTTIQRRWGRYSSTISYVDGLAQYTPDSPYPVNLASTAVTFYTRGENFPCSQQTPNSTLFQQAGAARWR